MAIQITAYKYSLIGARTASNFARVSGPIFVRNLDCTEDSENVFRDCIAEHDLGLADCTHEQDAGVHCEGVALCTIFIHLHMIYIHIRTHMHILIIVEDKDIVLILLKEQMMLSTSLESIVTSSHNLHCRNLKKYL